MEIYNVFCLNRVFTEMFIEMLSTFHMTFVQISDFDWLPGLQKRETFEKMLQKSSQKPYLWMKRVLCIHISKKYYKKVSSNHLDFDKITYFDRLS